eukprot:scaffold2639_cov361-Pavlova_lutheri.AAC.26
MGCPCKRKQPRNISSRAHAPATFSRCKRRCFGIADRSHASQKYFQVVLSVLVPSSAATSRDLA